MRSCSRGAMRPRLASASPSFRTEGAGKAGRRLHPRSCAQEAHEWTTGSTGSLRLSLHEWFTAYFVLSPVTGLFATVGLRIDGTSQTRPGRVHLPTTCRHHRGARATRLRRPRPSRATELARPRPHRDVHQPDQPHWSDDVR